MLCCMKDTASIPSVMDSAGVGSPRKASNGETPVAADVIKLRVYSTHANWETHVVWFDEATHQRTAYSSWLALSAWLLVCR